jgi:hypothetical protein
VSHSLSPSSLIFSSPSIDRQVNQRGFVQIKNLLKNLSPIQVSQYLVHVSEFDIEKNRIAALKLILELMNEYCQDPEILQQVVKK